MKKIIGLSILLLIGSSIAWAERPSLSVLPAPGTSVAKTPQTLTRAEQRKRFKQRRKQIRQLVKAYHKASAEEQPAILAKLQEVVAQSTQAGLIYVKERIAAERANLDGWEEKVKQDEQNLAQISKGRVQALLAKDAKKQHKARKKAWKKQIKEARKQMR